MPIFKLGDYLMTLNLYKCICCGGRTTLKPLFVGKGGRPFNFVVCQDCIKKMNEMEEINHNLKNTKGENSNDYM
jgi:hypothetical protein